MIYSVENRHSSQSQIRITTKNDYDDVPATVFKSILFPVFSTSSSMRFSFHRPMSMKASIYTVPLPFGPSTLNDMSAFPVGPEI